MPTPVRAKHRRGGDTVLRVETTRYYTIPEAARTLALARPDQPALRGEYHLRQALNTAASKPRGSLDHADAALAATYEDNIRRLQRKLVKYDGNNRWVGAESESAQTIRVDAHSFYSQQEAAYEIACALGALPSRVGVHTLQRSIQAAARARLERRPALLATRDPDAEVVDEVSTLLTDFGIF